MGCRLSNVGALHWYCNAIQNLHAPGEWRTQSVGKGELLPQGSAKSAPKRRPTRKRALASPPPELLCVPKRTTTAALRTLCSQALRGVYHMLHKFQV
jgi:hypothetical protein